MSGRTNGPKDKGIPGPGSYDLGQIGTNGSKMGKSKNNGFGTSQRNTIDLINH